MKQRMPPCCLTESGLAEVLTPGQVRTVRLRFDRGHGTYRIEFETLTAGVVGVKKVLGGEREWRRLGSALVFAKTLAGYKTPYEIFDEE